MDIKPFSQFLNESAEVSNTSPASAADADSANIATPEKPLEDDEDE